MPAGVIDNTVLINFAHVQRPRLLEQAFANLVSVPAVMEVLTIGQERGRIPLVEWSWLSIVDLTPSDKMLSQEIRQVLGRGEAEYIAVAQSRALFILSDDRDARRIAQRKGLVVTGTLGALMNLARQDTL
jgi:predicted nucleic acid-binding protein